MSLVWVVAALGILPSAAAAHTFSQSSLQLSFSGPTAHGQWRIQLRDLDALLGLDADRDQQVSSSELEQNTDALASYLLDRIELHADGAACTLASENSRLAGEYLLFAFRAHCPAAPRRAALRYDLFFDHDANHTAQVIVHSPGERQDATAVVRADTRTIELLLGSQDVWRRTLAYLREGVWHIWIGYDHMLFLCTLLLPAVLLRTRDGVRPAPHFRSALLEVVKIVSAFTLAHSLTLSLAALQLVELPSRWVEATIAASVCWAALNNLHHWVTTRTWLVVFGFGLVHGFGFASVLQELALPSSLLLAALAAFNAGVEVGQLAIVAAVFPLAFALRGFRWYVPLALGGGSLVIAAIGGVWLFERALATSLPQALALLTGATWLAHAALTTAAAALVLFVFAAGATQLARRSRLATLLTIALLGAGVMHTVEAVEANRQALQGELRELQQSALRASQERAWSEAAALLDRATEVAEALDDARAQAEVWRRIGSLRVLEADLPGARTAYERALTLSQGAGDLRGQAAAERQLGLVARLAGDRALAMRRYRHAFAAHERLGLGAHAASDAAELAALYVDAKLFSDAEWMYARAIAIGQAQRDETQVARLSAELGALHQQKSEPSAAAQWFERAALLHERASRPVDAANQYANLARARREEGKLDEARSLYARSLELFGQHGELARAGRVQRLLNELASEAAAAVTVQ